MFAINTLVVTILTPVCIFGYQQGAKERITHIFYGSRMNWKNAIRYPIDIRRARRLLASRDPMLRPIENRLGRPIVLNLQTNGFAIDCARHLMTFAQWSEQIGSPLYIRCSEQVLSVISRKIHGKEILAETNVEWINDECSSESLPPKALVLNDCPNPDPNLTRDGRTSLELQIGRTINREIPVAPYPMHPATVRCYDLAKLRSLRTHSRRWNLFFAGNQKPRYGSSKMRQAFSMASRLELLNWLRRNHSTSIRTTLPNENASADMVILNSKNVPIATHDWMQTIATSRFFLCCPGAGQPTCHNLVEAMSVGTIPLLEYGDRMTPTLIDGENAVCFRGIRGLADAIDRIHGFTETEITAMSQRASEYFDRHLRGDRFLSSIRDETIDLSAGKICVPFHEQDLYWQVLKTPSAKAA